MAPKEEVRVIGWDDGAFDFHQNEPVPLVGAITRGGKWLEGVLKTEIEVDGLDVTEKLITSVKRSRHRKQLRLIMLDGITFAGLNVADLEDIYQETKIPTMAVSRKEVNWSNFKKALGKLSAGEERSRKVKKAGRQKRVEVRGGEIFFQHRGLEEAEGREMIRTTATHSRLPEPLRIAHLIATAISLGESRGGS